MSSTTIDGRDPQHVVEHQAPAADSRARRLAALVRSATRGARPREAATVIAVLVLLELIIFFGYFTGTYTPAPDDFIGSYNNEAWAWWRDATLTDLPDWVPYAWGGYPAAVSLQSGAWYLPLGVASLLAPYSIHAAAVLQALTVGFGALGVYVLGRTWRLHHIAAMLGLVAYFFAVGAYSNALHPDIVRGFAWAPWVILCVSPSFPWPRWWAVPAAAVVVWQTLVGTYPGVTVALVYCCAVLVLVFQLTGRHPFRAYLLPLGIAGLGAALLCVPKYLAALQLRGLDSPTGLDESVFSPRMIGTLFYPYDFPWLPNDLSMRSFFVVAPCWVLIVLLRRRGARVAAPVLAFVATAVVLGLPFWPWYDATALLPGLSLSRFRMSDFRVPIVLGVVLAAMIATSTAVSAPAPFSRRGRTVRLVMLAMISLGALAAAELGGYPAAAWSTPWTILVCSALLVVLLGSLTGRPRSLGLGGEHVAAVGLVVLAGVSGVNWAYATMPPWRQELAPIEVAAWGTTSDELIEDYEVAQGVRRPARTPLDDAAAPPTDVHWNTSFYTGDDAVGGYVNLRGTGAFTAALTATTSADPQTYLRSRSILAAPGLGIAVDDDTALPTQDLVEKCAQTNECGPGLRVEPVSYEVGTLSYRVDAQGPTRLLFNESFYPGWTIEACRTGTRYCRDLPVRSGGAGLVLTELPVGGQWNVTLAYETPGKTRDAAAFLLGLVILALPGTVRHIRRSAATTQEPPTT